MVTTCTDFSIRIFYHICARVSMVRIERTTLQNIADSSLILFFTGYFKTMLYKKILYWYVFPLISLIIPIRDFLLIVVWSHFCDKLLQLFKSYLLNDIRSFYNTRAPVRTF